MLPSKVLRDDPTTGDFDKQKKELLDSLQEQMVERFTDIDDGMLRATSIANFNLWHAAQGY